MPSTAPKISVNHDGVVVCRHRDLSCCPTCFTETPGLIDVYEQVFVFDEECWAADELGAIRAGALRGVRVSPGTFPAGGAS